MDCKTERRRAGKGVEGKSRSEGGAEGEKRKPGVMEGEGGGG